MEHIERMEIKNDGFLFVKIDDIDAFDTYLYMKILKDGYCIHMQKDIYDESILYFDIHNMETLQSYFSSHIFTTREAWSFIIGIIQVLNECSGINGLIWNLEYMYTSFDHTHIAFLSIPICCKHDVTQDINSWLKQLLSLLQIENDYDFIGYLFVLSKMKIRNIGHLLDKLWFYHDQYLMKQTRFRFWMKKIEPFMFSCFPARYENVSYPSLSAHQDDSGGTSILFCDHNCSFERIEDGSIYVISKDQIHIGRASDNDLCIAYPQISSHHALFDMETMILKDLSSSNGTKVNQERIQEIKLKNGDIVSFANIQYKFRENSV